jgi:hypothetical protein
MGEEVASGLEGLAGPLEKSKIAVVIIVGRVLVVGVGVSVI